MVGSEQIIIQAKAPKGGLAFKVRQGVSDGILGGVMLPSSDQAMASMVRLGLPS